MMASQDIHSAEYVADLFDRCAPSYRRWSAVSSFGFVWRWRKACVAMLPEPDGPAPEILDLMAGTGELWPHLLRRFPDATITAVDISRQMHLIALERLHQTRAERITHLQADILSMEIEPDIADALTASFGLKTMTPDQLTLIARFIARVLKPGASYALIEASDPKGWGLRPLFRVYLDGVLPLVERYLLRGARDFSMIGIYTRRFGSCAAFAEALRSQGLTVTETRHMFGCATGVYGRKPQ